MAEQKSAQERLPQPLRAAASTLQKVPGAGMVSRAAEGTLDRIGAVSPRGRRMAVYTGAGVLGVAGLVEWPVAVTGAAVAWLTQPRPQEKAEAEGAESTGTAGDLEGVGAAAGTASTAGIEGTAGSGPTSAHRDVATTAAEESAAGESAAGESSEDVGAAVPYESKAAGRSGASSAGRRKASPTGGGGGSAATTGEAG